MSTYDTDPGLDFENWISHDLPKQLNLSASKETAIKLKFGGFADYVRQLEKKAPQEYELFYKTLRKKFEEISKWRAPKGKRSIRGYGLLRKE